MDEHYLKPADIPLIITSANSSPETLRKNSDNVRLITDKVYDSKSDNEEDTNKNSSDNSKVIDSHYKLSAERRTLGGSLKYEIGRTRSGSTIINVPAKWSSVRIKGTSFNDSRKSIVKLEPCNGIGLAGNDYQNLKNAHNITNFGEVS